MTCLGCGVTQPPAPRCVACGEPLQDAIRAVTAQAEDAFVTIPIQSASRPATPDVEPVVTALPHSVRPSVSSPPVVAPLLSARPVTSESNAEPDTIDEMVSLSIPPVVVRGAEGSSADLEGVPARLSQVGEDVLADRRIATVLFADVTGFTALSESLEPDEIAELINQCFTGMTQAVLRRGGTVDKYMGDAIMAVFGAPVGHLDDPDRAVMAAVEMQDWLDDYSERSRRSGGPEVIVRVGVHTGEVLAGAIGAAGHASYTVIGDTVNVASRIEAAAEPGTVLISDSTFRRLRGSYDHEAQDPLVVKGQSKPLTVHRITRVNRKQKTVGRAVTVGFEKSLEQIEARLTEILGGATDRLLEIRADPGMGTWNLIEATRDLVEEEGGQSFVLSSRSETRLMAMAPFKGLLQYLAELDPEAPPAFQRDQLSLWLHSSFADGEAVSAQAGLRYWEAILFGQEGAEPLRPGARASAFVQMKRYLEKRTEEKPLLLVFERIEDFDSASLEFVGELARDGELRRLILLATTRRTVSSWTAHEPMRTVIYPPRLNHDDSKRWLAAYLGLDGVPAEDWVNDVVRTAGGGSGRLARICDELVRSGILRIDQGRAVIQGEFDRSAELQSSLRELVQVRIDRLPEDALKLLRVASILRTSAPQSIYSELLPEIGPEEMHKGIARLTAEGLLSIQRGTGELRVPASRISESVRQSIPAKVRQDYAGRGYEAFGRLTGDDAHDPVVMAELALDAGRRDASVTWFRRAAQRARRTLAFREATDLCHRVLGITSDSKLRIEMMCRLGWLAFDMGDYEISRSRSKAAIELVEALEHRIDMLILVIRCDLALGDFEAARISARSANHQFPDQGFDLERCRLQSLHGIICLRSGELTEAQKLMDDALDQARRLTMDSEASDLVVELLNHKVIVEQRLGHLEDSLSAAQEAFERLGDHGDPILLGRLHQAAAQIYEGMGDFESARHETETAIRFAEQVNNHTALASRYMNLCSYEMRLGETEAAKKSLARADRYLVNSRARWLGVPLYITQLHVAVRSEDLTLFEKGIEKLSMAMEQTVSSGVRARAVGELGQLAKLAGEGGAMQAAVGDLLRLARSFDTGTEDQLG